MTSLVHPAPTSTTRRISATASAHLDIARALAAMAVFVQHARSVFLVDWNQTTVHSALAAAVYLLAKFGHAAVVVFFVLSGFLVGGSGLRAIENGTWSFPRYMLHRTLRLEIVLIPALLLGMLWDRTGVHVFHAFPLYNGEWHLLVRWSRLDLRWSTLMGNVVFLQGIRIPTFGTNSALWSLANEFWYYVLYGLLVTAFLTRMRAGWRVLLIVLAACASWFAGFMVMLMAPLWFMGLAVYLLPRLELSRATRRYLLILSLLLFAGALIASETVHPGQYTQGPYVDLLTGLFFCGVLYAMLHANPAGVRYQRFAHHFAAPSYTLYANHIPPLIFLLAWIGVQRSPSPLYCLELAGWCVVCWLYAYGLYLLFESRTQVVRGWLEPRLFPKLSRNS